MSTGSHRTHAGVVILVLWDWLWVTGTGVLAVAILVLLLTFAISLKDAIGYNSIFEYMLKRRFVESTVLLTTVLSVLGSLSGLIGVVVRDVKGHLLLLHSRWLLLPAGCWFLYYAMRDRVGVVRMSHLLWFLIPVTVIGFNAWLLDRPKVKARFRREVA